jgi:toxin ParE1/3/4
MRLIWARPSLNDLESINDYIASDSPAAALDQLDAIETQVRLLVDHPRLGRMGRVQGTRELVVARTPYVVVYRVVGEAIEILRVMHAARRWPPIP